MLLFFFFLALCGRKYASKPIDICMFITYTVFSSYFPTNRKNVNTSVRPNNFYLRHILENIFSLLLLFAAMLLLAFALMFFNLYISPHVYWAKNVLMDELHKVNMNCTSSFKQVTSKICHKSWVKARALCFLFV